jgi:arabinose-5-phosphate isomerase
MLADILENEKKYINYFFEHLDLEAAEAVLQCCYRCEGIIFFTGVGKSEVMAQKIASTLTSTGTRALFLAPTNALHGDIGILSDKDLFVILSKSGESEELLNLLPYIRNRGTTIISIVSNGNSHLAKSADLTVILPIEKELCPFDLAPTISAQAQIIFGDLLAVGLMKLKNFSLDEYAKNHPAGTIGKRITTRVSDLMISHASAPLCRPSDRVIDTLVELSKKRCGCVLIADEEHRLQGIFTDGDLGRALNAEGASILNQPISALMIKNPRSIAPEALAWKALQEMENDPHNPITVLAVTDPMQKILGLIKMHDIVQAGI